jgi:hypothetical protein
MTSPRPLIMKPVPVARTASSFVGSGRDGGRGGDTATDGAGSLHAGRSYPATQWITRYSAADRCSVERRLARASLASPCASGSAPVIAARPSRTSYNRSRRLLDGSAGRSWRSTATRASVAPRGATGGLGWMRLAALKGGRLGRASHKRTFSGEPQIGSDSVLKTAMQHPRTHSRNPRLDCTGVGRVLGDI